jgi:hypothetical protein
MKKKLNNSGPWLESAGKHSIYTHTVVQEMQVRKVGDPAERARLWELAVAAYPPYAECQTRTSRPIPVFVAEPVR